MEIRDDFPKIENDGTCHAVLKDGFRCPKPAFQKLNGNYSKWCKEHTPSCQKLNNLYKNKCKGFEDWKCNRNTSATHAFIFSNQLDSCISHRREFENECLHASKRDKGHKEFIKDLITHKYICRDLIQQLSPSKKKDTQTLEQLYENLVLIREPQKETITTKITSEPVIIQQSTTGVSKKSKSKKKSKAENKEEETEEEMMERMQKENDELSKTHEVQLQVGRQLVTKMKTDLTPKEKQKIIQDTKASFQDQFYEKFKIHPTIPYQKLPSKLLELYQKLLQERIDFELKEEKTKLLRKRIIEQYQTYIKRWENILKLMSNIIPDFEILFSDPNLMKDYLTCSVRLQQIKQDLETRLHEPDFHQLIIDMTNDMNDLKNRVTVYATQLKNL